MSVYFVKHNLRQKKDKKKIQDHTCIHSWNTNNRNNIQIMNFELKNKVFVNLNKMHL